MHRNFSVLNLTCFIYVEFNNKVIGTSEGAKIFILFSLSLVRFVVVVGSFLWLESSPLFSFHVRSARETR